MTEKKDVKGCPGLGQVTGQINYGGASLLPRNSVSSMRNEHDHPQLEENGFAKKSKISMAEEHPAGSRLTINPIYTEPAFKNAVSVLLKAWKEGTVPACPGDVQPALNFVFRKPFPHLIFPNFFRGPIEAVEEELLAQKFNNLSTDLLQLSQTKELSHEKVFEFRDVTVTFHQDVRPWVEDITNVQLLPTVDIRGAKYSFTDHLVCHDDRLASRKVAYVYYLTDPSWSPEDGGSLDLFDSICSNDCIVPGAVEKSVLPVRNTIVLFLVGDDSFHQVREVLSTRKTRLSLTGWFHAKSTPTQRPEYQEHSELQHLEIIEAKKEEIDSCFLVRSDSQTANRIRAIAKDLETYQGCIVRNVISDKFYQAIVEELRLKADSLAWLVPPNRNQAGCYRYVDVAPQKWAKEMSSFHQLLRVFMTERFLHSLGEITGMNVSIMPATEVLSTGSAKKDVIVSGSGSYAADVSSSSPDEESWVVELAQCRLEKFEPGHYTLKTMDTVQLDDVIDIFYFMDCDNLEPGCGGSVCVVEVNESSDDWDPIVTLDGESNGMIILRRDKDIVFFTEYLNERWARRNSGRPFYRLWMSFKAEDIPTVPARGGAVDTALESSDSGGDDDESEVSDEMDQDEIDALSASDYDEEEEEE